MLHLQHAAAVPGTARGHGLWVEHVDLDEVVGCQLLKPCPLSLPLCSARLHQSPYFISLGDSCSDTTLTHKTMAVMPDSDWVI